MWYVQRTTKSSGLHRLSVPTECEGDGLAEGAQLTRDVPLNWTTAQKSDPRNFSAGQVLGFNRAVKGIAKNETLEVVRVADKSVVVRNAVGEERTLTAKQAKSFDVYERRSIEVATGDRLLLTANRRENGFRATNGEIVTVAEVDRTGRICLEDGRTLPAGFRHFTHGYAVTAHRSQGKSVDAVIISGDGMRKELFYVAASRGRQSVQVVTSDKESLRESVARSSVRKSASELARKAGTVFVRGACRGIMAARHLAMRLSMRETESVPAEINYQTSPDKTNPEWSDIVNAVSVDRQRNWKAIGTERQTGLEIVLLKRTYVFPWSQFLYAEGGDDEIRAVFTTHDLIVRGTALTGLLAELAGQRIARLQEPARTDRFEESSGPVVRQLIVERVQEARV